VTGGDEYIVVFKPGSSRKRSLPVFTHIAQVLTSLDLSPDNDDVTHIFNGSMFNGFSAKMKSHCIDALNAMEDIDVVEKVQLVTKSQAVRKSQDTITIQMDDQATWGLQAISSSPQSITDVQGFSHQYSFSANSTLGQGVDVYVIDTGIDTTHEVFATADGGSRADLTSFLPSQVDDEGHGTHVSGTIGGTSVGVAPLASLHGIKVLDSTGSGSTTTILQGMELAADQHAARRNQDGFVGSVVNMSLGSPRSRTINNAAIALVNAGIHVVVAAGNENDDACNYSPSGVGGKRGNVISVGAIGSTYQASTFSNFGDCVDVYAPGENIVSAGITSNTAVASMAGTSMASPHIAGLVTYFLSMKPDLATDPAGMKDFLKANAQGGIITGVTSGNPLLANNGIVI
jgi:cerevisin